MRYLIRLYALLSCVFVVGCSVESFLQEPESTQEPEVPRYFREHIKDKESETNYVIQSAKDNSASFIFFTDAHWGSNQKNSPALIRHILYSTPISDVIFGGDVITTFFENPKDALDLGKDFQRSFDNLDCNMYYLYGNHDNNSDCNPDLISRHLTEDQVFDYLQSRMGPCTYGDYYNFYFDREPSKTRFICLDTGRFYYSVFRTKTLDTAAFVIDALNSTPDGWHVVVLSHLWTELKKDVNGVYEAFVPAFHHSFLDLFDAFNNRSTGSFVYNRNSVYYDFSGVSSRIICCIGGHNHLDALLYSSGGIPVIINTTDSSQTINGISAKKGTTAEQSISIFVIDYAHSNLRRFRVGRGDDLTIQLDL